MVGLQCPSMTVTRMGDTDQSPGCEYLENALPPGERDKTRASGTVEAAIGGCMEGCWSCAAILDRWVRGAGREVGSQEGRFHRVHYGSVSRMVTRWVVGCLLGIVAGLLSVSELSAQASDPNPVGGGDLQQRYDAAFQEMVRKPADLDALFTFATLASQNNDLEGAISALERMLLINPDLPRVRLELGVLYYRLGSYEVARTYLETALQSSALPPDVRSRAEQFMAEIQKRQSRSRFSGEFFLGTRYQSNANLGPPTSSVRLFGQVANSGQHARRPR